jgi:hypothetical protein
MADWSARRDPPFTDDEEAGYGFASNPLYGPASFGGWGGCKSVIRSRAPCEAIAAIMMRCR